MSRIRIPVLVGIGSAGLDAAFNISGYQNAILAWFLAIISLGSFVYAFWEWKKHEKTKADTSIAPLLPKSLREHFDTDFSNCTKTFNTLQISREGNPPSTFDVPWQVCMEDHAGAKFVTFYVATVPDTLDMCATLSNAVEQVLNHQEQSGIKILTRHPGDATHTELHHMKFSGRVYLYHEDPLSLAQLGTLESIYKAKNLTPQFRGPTYPSARWMQQKATLA